MAKKGNGLDLTLTNDYLRQILDLGREQNRKFDVLNGKFDVLNGKFDEVNGKFDEMNGKFDGLNRKFEEMSRKLDELPVIKDRLTAIEVSIRKVAEFVGQDRVRQDQKIDDMERRLEALEHKAA